MTWTKVSSVTYKCFEYILSMFSIQGTDITEFFEAHHISPSTATYLETFKVRDAKEPRNYKFTFSDTGFYRTLKRKVHQKLKTIDRSVEIRSKVSGMQSAIY